jgi:uncharacterized protein (DUF2252 family)
MLVSPFTFYRGAALIMAADLAGTPCSGLTTQVCGDAHLMNFGVFGTPERRLVFDINDFDETTHGPWEWDVKRLAVSFAVAGRDNGFTTAQRKAVLLELVGAYRGAMRAFATMGHLEVWYAHLDVDVMLQQLEDTLSATARKRARANIAKARTHDSTHALAKLTEVVDGERRIISDPPLIQPIEELMGTATTEGTLDFLHDLLAEYRNTLQPDRRHLLEGFRVHHAARKVVGVGSVGTRAWIMLLFGRDGDDPLILQAKEAQASVLTDYVGSVRELNNGERVVNGQRIMQATSDIFLGWHSITDPAGTPRDYYLRQLKDWKGSADVEAMNPSTMTVYAQLCGWTLARAHARSGDRIAVGSYLGGSPTFDHAVAEFSETYADQNERDYQALVEAEAAGIIEVQRGL